MAWCHQAPSHNLSHCWPVSGNVLNNWGLCKLASVLRHLHLGGILNIFCQVLLWIPEHPINDIYVNIGSGNDLVLSINKPLPEPVYTKFHEFICIFKTIQQLKEKTNIKLKSLEIFSLVAEMYAWQSDFIFVEFLHPVHQNGLPSHGALQTGRVTPHPSG